MKRARRVLANALLLLSSVCFACWSDEVREDAEVVVFIDADEALEAQLAKIVVEVRDEAGAVVTGQAEFTLSSAPKLPISFGVFQPPGGAGWFMLQARGYDAAGAPLVEYKTVAAFAARRTVQLEVELASACARKFCGERADQSCNALTGQCEGVVRQTPMEPPAEEAGTIVSEPNEAGVVIGGKVDAGDAGSNAPAGDAGDAGAPRDGGQDAGGANPVMDGGMRDGGDAGSDGGREASVPSEPDTGAAWGLTLPSITNYAGAGPFSISSTESTGPNNAYTVTRPNRLGDHGFTHPLAVFGPGILTEPSTYGPLVGQLASHGFVIIGVNSLSGSPGSPANLTAMREGLDWLIAQNALEGVYQGRLATNRAVAMGYSVGATAAVQLSSHAAVVTTVAIHGHNTSGDPRGPVLLMTGSNDVIADVRMTQATLTEAPSILVALPIGHLDVLTEIGSAGRYVAPITAWLRYWVNGDQAAKRYFWGTSCDMCTSPWLTPETNAPWRAQSL